MPLSNEELGEHVASLERLLQGNPAGQTAALADYVHKLEAFAASGDHVPIERTLQLFGTAVGGRSMFCIPLDSSFLTGHRKMADSVQRQRHSCLRPRRFVRSPPRGTDREAVLESRWQCCCRQRYCIPNGTFYDAG